MDIQAEIKNALSIERDALGGLIERLGDEVEGAVALLRDCRGRVVVTGVGKTGLVGQKIAATLSSTGTAAVFLHAGEAMHGDLGMVGADDVVIAISNSGESSEIVELLTYLKRLGTKIVALTGAANSTLAIKSDVVIDVGVAVEADPLGIVPTASTTAALAMGDALAVVLMKLRNFSKDQYAQYHPGGALGSMLLTQVKDLMVAEEQTPLVSGSLSMREALYEMTSKRLGAAFVIGDDGVLLGIITDGDLRRLFESESDPLSLTAAHVMKKDPKRLRAETPAIEAMKLMEAHSITVLPVVDENDRPISAIHMHDLVKAGLGQWSSE